MSLLLKYWYAPLIVFVVLYAGYQKVAADNLRSENEVMAFQLNAYELKDKNNQAKIIEADAARAQAEQRNLENEQFIGQIRNDTSNGEMAAVLARAINRVQGN